MGEGEGELILQGGMIVVIWTKSSMYNLSRHLWIGPWRLGGRASSPYTTYLTTYESDLEY